MPLDRKRHVLVVVDGEKIVWICGLRLDDRYKVVKETKNVLRLELRSPAPSRNGARSNGEAGR